VNLEEKKTAIKTSKIIRYARKSLGMTQKDLSHKLSISQGALSKLESGLLIPSVHQWFEVCGQLGVPADSHIYGYVDRLEPAQFNAQVVETPFQLKPQYRTLAASTSRSIYPILKWVEKKLGYDKTEELIKSMGVDPDYFTDLSLPISFRFISDLVEILIQEGHLPKSQLTNLAQAVTQPTNHGQLYAFYQQSSQLEGLMKAILSKSFFYEQNFDYKIESASSRKVSFSIEPHRHMSESIVGLEKSKSFLSTYREGYFKNLVESILRDQKVKVSRLGSCFKNSNRCIYQLELA
jgi:transcriptional regulator with XRE-family HTH domain